MCDGWIRGSAGLNSAAGKCLSVGRQRRTRPDECALRVSGSSCSTGSSKGSGRPVQAEQTRVLKRRYGFPVQRQNIYSFLFFSKCSL